MEFNIGTKVQAIDELGRWENGKIIAVDSNSFEVKFDGWGTDYNVFAKAAEVRKPVDIFTSEIGKLAFSHDN
ncbi:hypothetical protein HOLleu_30524 [Holothuria leucospilota]|uniref:Uncharacterized protein n=1 Tax=Holothuria leucospilota TaxID=206669 RepID=A0A9Q1H178_HOLLE|nr:hypothetical protein HOLleu_30524 [Holothuria leucospilota]